MSKDNKFLATIGLEIHAELKTNSKMFCACKNDPDEERANANVCPICMGHPGTLPVINHEAIQHVLSIGTAVDGTLADFTEWDRKNYFYPDIPKGYQISQYKYPLVSGGTLADVEIERIHLEEDTAQSTHDTHEMSLVNFNRSGVPLMELVTKPVIHDSATAVRFAKELQLLLRYLGVGEANMEKGEMRVEANISVSPIGSDVLGTKTEVKNLNSFRAVEKAIEYEIERQIYAIEHGEKVVQETRGWDDSTGKTFSQRSKESSHDYRYFPDPDIPKLKISEIPEFAHDKLKASLPELPWAKRIRYKSDYNMTDKEVAVFVDFPHISKYFESIVGTFKKDESKKIRLTINYLLTDYLGLLKKLPARDSTSGQSTDSESDTDSNINLISRAHFKELIDMADAGDISSRGAKDILALLVEQASASLASPTAPTPSEILGPKALADKHGLIQKSNEADLIPIIDKIIADNASVFAEYKAGKVASLQFLIGQAMKATKGSANPALLKKLFEGK